SPTPGGLWTPMNVNEARIRGVELSTGFEWDGWRGDAALTLLDTEDRETGNRLQRRSGKTLRLDLSKRVGTWDFGGTVVAEGYRYDDRSNNDRLPGFATLALRAGWRFAPDWSTRLTLANVLDKEYTTARYDGQNDLDYIAAGRSAMLTVRYDIRYPRSILAGEAPVVKLKGYIVMLGWVLLSVPASASSVCATDDLGDEVCLARPAERIAALSPGATELVWAAGAGDQVAAVVAYSDYPPAAKEVTSVGSHTRMDMERLLQLQPDLVIGWVTGNPTEQLATLKELGIPVFSIEPRSFEAVPHTIERLSVLAGTEAEGFAEAERFRQGIAGLRAQFAESKPVPVFYQVWDEPLMTVDNDHLIGEMIQLGAGDDVVGHLERLVARISTE